MAPRRNNHKRRHPAVNAKEKDLEKEEKAQHQHLNRYRSNTIAINDDIIFNILTRLPVAYLLRCKTVCKSWYNLISDPSFVSAHLDHSKEKRKLAAVPIIPSQQMIEIYEYEEQEACFSTCLFWKELPGFQELSTHVSHSDGLLLLIQRAGSFVCNPCTRDFTLVPKGGHDSNGYPKRTMCGFGFVPGTNVLKIAQFFYRSYNYAEGTCRTGFEVFTFGVDSSWRVMAKDPPYPVSGSDAISASAISASGAIYFKIDNTLHKTPPKFILSFDLRDENFTVIPPPPFLSFSENLSCCWTGLDDALCVYKYTKEMNFNLWIYKEHTWINSFTFQLPRDILITPLTVRDEKLVLQVCYDGDEEKVVVFDPENKSFATEAHITGHCMFHDASGWLFYDHPYEYSVFSYVESLKPARPKKIEV